MAGTGVLYAAVTVVCTTILYCSTGRPVFSCGLCWRCAHPCHWSACCGEPARTLNKNHITLCIATHTPVYHTQYHPLKKTKSPLFWVSYLLAGHPLTAEWSTGEPLCRQVSPCTTSTSRYSIPCPASAAADAAASVAGCPWLYQNAGRLY